MISENEYLSLGPGGPREANLLDLWANMQVNDLIHASTVSK